MATSLLVIHDPGKPPLPSFSPSSLSSSVSLSFLSPSLSLSSPLLLCSLPPPTFHLLPAPYLTFPYLSHSLSPSESSLCIHYCHLFSIPHSSPLVQFQLLHSKFHLCSVPTRALILSTYVKFINLFPEIKPQIQKFLSSDSQSRNGNQELQQRAIEYLQLTTIATPDVLVSTTD